MPEIVNINPTNLTSGEHLYTAPDPVPTASYATFELVLLEADKLASNVSLTWEFYFSSDAGANWQFANGSTWTSYGPGGFLLTNMDGTTTQNPNPRLQIGLVGRAGHLLRCRLLLAQALRVGVIISVD